MRFLVLLSVWFSLSTAFALDDDAPEPALDPRPFHSILIPALEVPAINLTIWAFNRYALQADYAYISAASIKRNLSGPWTYDVDSFEVNQFGHPYQGAMSFTAARSSGLNFWSSFLFPFFGSLMWELAMEVDSPSINDQITTPIAGALVGEAMHRLSSALLFGEAGIGKQILAGVLNPIRALNRNLFGLWADDDDGRRPPVMIGRLMAGLTLRSPVFGEVEPPEEGFDRVRRSLTVATRILHGFPGDPSVNPRVPFDHFDLSAEAQLSATPVAKLSMHGLLWGGQWGEGLGFRGLGGFYAFYDFANPKPFRVSTVALGAGTMFGWTIADTVPLFVTVASGFVPMGAAGAPMSDDDERGYHIGPGNLSLVQVVAMLPGVGFVMLDAHHTALRGVRAQKGWENITRVEATAEVNITNCQSVGVRFTWNRRHAGFEREIVDVNQRASGLFAHWAWRFGEFARQACGDEG